MHKFKNRGVSLIEALVAMAVMAIGMLGVVGMQSTLRSNADLSRQRAEAVRIAQAEVERIRNFSALATADVDPDLGQTAFDAIASAPAASVPTDHSNTEFFRQVIVDPPESGDPLVRHFSVRVTWQDRAGLAQAVELRSLVAGMPPQLGSLSSLRSDRGPLQQPRGRNAAVPRMATDVSGGAQSRFTPPGAADGSYWLFDNASARIISQCTASSCETPENAWLLLSGTVAFATAASQPGSLEAELPSEPAFALTIRVRLSATNIISCFTETLATRVNYFCAVPSNAIGQWSGYVIFSSTSPTLSTLETDTGSGLRRVCRYTPDSRNLTAVPTTETPTFYNARHPWRYVGVNGPLTDKNFLIIRAGNGSAIFTCPTENTSTLVQSNTHVHLPP